MSDKPKQVVDFEHLCNTSLADFLNVCCNIGEPISSLALKVQTAFQKTIDVIDYGLHHPEPPKDSEVMAQYFNAVKAIVDMNISPKDAFSNHFCTVKEAIVALGWINVKPAPTQFIRDMKEAGEYYANRVLLNNKGDQNHMNFVNKWNMLLLDLQQYVKTHFLTGFTWGAGQAVKFTPAGPFPPPPPPPPQFADAHAPGDDCRQALLNDLNQGANVMRNLKHIDRKQLTTATVTTPPKDSPGKKFGTSAKTSHSYPPKFELEGRKWNVEYQTNNVLTVNNDDMSQSLAMYKCLDTSLEVKNKMNSVVIDSCKKCNLVVKSVISSVEMIRCDHVKIQLEGNVPLLNMDNCDSVQIFTTPASQNVEIISSKSTSCNICIVEPNGDYKEHPIPEQIKTVLVDGNHLKSSVLEKN